MNGTMSVPDLWLDPYTASLIEMTTRIYLGIPATLFGTVANTMCLCVFINLGWKDPVNMKLACLTAADLCLFLCALAHNTMELLLDVGSESAAYTAQLVLCIIGWPVSSIFQLSGCITVFLAAERCLSITIPLEVKRVMTNRVGAKIMSFIFILFVLNLVPIYIGLRYVWKVGGNNRTVLDVVFTNEIRIAQNVSQGVMTVTQIVCYVAMLIFTTMLISGLNQHAQKRQRILQQSSGIDSVKERRVVKMVALIAVFYIVFSFPQLIMVLFSILAPEVNTYGYQSSTFFAGWGIASLSNCVNGSVNIGIYLTMSTAFKREFRKTFCRP